MATSIAGGSASNINFAVSETGTIGIATAVKYSPSIAHAISWTDGSGASASQKVGSIEVTIGGSPTDLDLAGTSFTDVEGNSITFTSVKGIAFSTVYSTANSGNVTIGNHGTNDWATFLSAGGTLTLEPGTTVGMHTTDAAGYVVTAATGDIIRVNGTSGDKVKIIVFGNE